MTGRHRFPLRYVLVVTQLVERLGHQRYLRVLDEELLNLLFALGVLGVNVDCVDVVARFLGLSAGVGPLLLGWLIEALVGRSRVGLLARKFIQAHRPFF